MVLLEKMKYEENWLKNGEVVETKEWDEESDEEKEIRLLKERLSLAELKIEALEVK